MQRSDNSWHTAEVIHRRLIVEGSDTTTLDGPSNVKIKKTEKGGSGDGVPVESKPDQAKHSSTDDGEDRYEYYVHYSGFNRRLDEWVRRDRMKSAEEDVRNVRVFNFTEQSSI